jgi:hypothetical protein
MWERHTGDSYSPNPQRLKINHFNISMNITTYEICVKWGIKMFRNNNNNNDNNNNNKVEISWSKVTILWNQQVQTDRTIPNNKPDIVIRYNEKGTCMLIDVAIPVDRNVIQKEAEKILKYKYLKIEIQRM